MRKFNLFYFGSDALRSIGEEQIVIHRFDGEGDGAINTNLITIVDVEVLDDVVALGESEAIGAPAAC